MAEIEGIVSDDCVLATNTSSLSVTSIATACNNTGRVVGIHFFNPAPLMKLVEIVPAVQSDAAVVEDCKNLIAGWKKLPVITKRYAGLYSEPSCSSILW